VSGLFETGFRDLELGNVLMLAIGLGLIHLGIPRKMEPLLLLPIGFGVLLANIPLTGLMEETAEGMPTGLISRIFHFSIGWEVIPPLIFLGLGALTGFRPLIANPKTFLLGAAAQVRKAGAIFILLVLVLVTFSLAACDSDSDSTTADDSTWRVKKESRGIAEDFLKSSPTFAYDGIESSIEQALGAEAVGPDKWRFLFGFACEHEGYGDRSDESLARKDTYHEALITVDNGEVVNAVVDSDWDMIEQKRREDWGWGEAGEQALYGVISVFFILILLTILTRVSGSIISNIESKQNTASNQ
jgi:hypothetical protein